MIRVHVYSDIGDLASDLTKTQETFPARLSNAVRTSIEKGNEAAKASGLRNAPIHGRHYVASMTTQMRGPLTGEYGPDRSRKDGNKNFEYGPGRQTRPHLNVTKSFDLTAPAFVRAARDAWDDASPW